MWLEFDGEGFRLRSLHTELMGLAEQTTDGCGVEPRPLEGFTDEPDQAPQSAAARDLRQMRGLLGHDVDEMPEPHQEVIAPHGFPVFREAMLVVISMMLLHQDAVLDRPAVTGAQITEFMDIAVVQRVAGDPGMA